ncbi:beta-ketoacyl synthase chain length factor [Alysiella sp.]|uniref:beta-ketoacyl synthase chain length factor n=1 Tax=Alysiella sp. TaxID=1872483 RepID=UPI0034C5F26C
MLADEPLHTDYTLPAQRAPFPYVLAMVLTQGQDYTISLQNEPNPNTHHSFYWGALNWIRFMLSGSLNHTQNYGSRIWQWQKNT